MGGGLCRAEDWGPMEAREGLFGGLLVQSLGSLGFHDPPFGRHCYRAYEDVNECSTLRWVMLWLRTELIGVCQ